MWLPDQNLEPFYRNSGFGPNPRTLFATIGIVSNASDLPDPLDQTDLFDASDPSLRSMHLILLSDLSDSGLGAWGPQDPGEGAHVP